MAICKKHFAGLSFLALAGTLLLPGCRQRSDSDDVQVRLINAVPDAGVLDVSVDGQRVWKGAAFRSSTGYQGIAAGAYGIRVDSETLRATLLVNRPLSFEKDHAYTVLTLGMARGSSAPTSIQILDDAPPEGVTGGKAGVRLINAAPGGGGLDLAVNNIVGLEGVRYGRRSDILLLDAGVYDLKIASSNTPDALAGPISLRLEPGRSYTLVAMGQAANQTLSLEAYPDAHQ